MVEQGFADLAADLGRAQCPDVRRSAGGALRAVAQAYWEFATGRPHLYRLMGSLPDVPFGTPATPASARECFRLLKAAMYAEGPDHPADAYDEDAATDLFWAHLHGLVTLTLDGRIKGGHARAHDLLHQLVDINRR
ncbi:TetR-like C-terminal domain-containing protein [Nonomuraea longicatena]|uniref:TetR-like C-terminal domain-containing protein n=1 Tax=Nonomuraea longicatena TaxID=83682 RepID=UPI003CD0A7AB